MGKNASLFWVIVTVTLAAVYLFSKPALLNKAESLIAEKWHDIISRPTPSIITPDEETEAVKEERVVEPEDMSDAIPQKRDQQGKTTGAATTQCQENKGDTVADNSQQSVLNPEPEQPVVPGVRPEDVLLPEPNEAGKGEKKEEMAPHKAIPL